MAPHPLSTRDPGPVGATVAEDIHVSIQDAETRAEHERLAPFEALARLVIMRRAALGLSQRQLAAKMGTTASAVSRIESGRHATNTRTLTRVAHALDAQAILGLQYGSAANARRDLVVL